MLEGVKGVKGEESIAELCRRGGISPNLYYTWSKEFLEAGKRRLQGDTKREATSGEGTRRGQLVGSRKRESGLVPGMKCVLKETVPERIRS